MEHSTLYMGVVRQTLARLLACTGAKMSQLTATDLIAYNMAREAEDDLSSASGIQVIWRALRETGWLEHESAAMPFVARFRNGQKSAEELVDQHGIRSPHREVFVEYFKARRPDVTYSTWVTVASKLLNTFWNRITCLQPGLKDFTITRAAIDPGQLPIGCSLPITLASPQSTPNDGETLMKPGLSGGTQTRSWTS